MPATRTSRRRRVRRLLAAAAILVAAAVLWCDRAVASAARGRIVASVNDVPAAHVALVLGTNPHLPSGEANPHYVARIDATAALYAAGKVRRILISGDNSRVGYNEPQAMKNDLVARGVPATAIVLDYAGFRTLDSVVRAREVFGVTEAIVVSQRFHLERAIYLGDRRGVRLTGWAAADAPRLNAARVRMREVIARAVAVTDVVLARSPKYLGPRIAVDG